MQRLGLLASDFKNHQIETSKSSEIDEKIWNSKNTYKYKPDDSNKYSRKYYTFFSSYHELFADFVTLVMTNNLDTSLVSMNVGSAGHSIYKGLSFKKENQNNTCGFMHLYFSFARPHIADKFFKPTETVEEKKMLIANFYNFISQDLIEKWNSNNTELKCEEANSNLIQKIKQIN